MAEYQIQLSIEKDSYFFNKWDYIEDVETKQGGITLCENLWDDTVHKLRLVNLTKNEIIWSRSSVG